MKDASVERVELQMSSCGCRVCLLELGFHSLGSVEIGGNWCSRGQPCFTVHQLAVLVDT